MATSIEDFEKKFCDIELILKKCTPASLPARFIDVNFTAEEFKDDSLHMQTKCEGLLHPFQASSVITAPIEDAKVLYPGGFSMKKIVELSLNIADNDCPSFCPGDTIGVFVSNSKSDVESAILCLQLNDKADNLCEISVSSKTTKKNAKVPQHIPRQTSARALLRDCLDLRSVPQKLFLRSLAEYTTDEYEQKFLHSVSSKEGSQLYNQLILDKARTCLDILQLCSSCCPSLSLLIEHLPRLKPRPYSIANSPIAHSSRLNIIFSVLPKNPGVATTYLTQKVERIMEGLRNPPEIAFYFREPNKFRFGEEEANANTILIAIGCGVAPFLGFIEHKDCLMKQSKRIYSGSIQLYIGSTCPESAVHREELQNFKERRTLYELYESFSRDPECKNFKYVQDQLRANAEKFVSEFLKEDTILYVCADNKISKSIEDCIKECWVKVFGCSVEEADVVVKEKRVSGKYREDLWV